jgi:hypothetical protein
MNNKLKVLLLGDSWMEDKSLSSTIGQGIASQSQKCVQTINGGTSSYSPTIYLLKARQAFNKYGKFDYIIANIDETDIGDEWLRYKIPTVRDISGKIVAVPFENDIHSRFIWNGKLWAENSSFYTLRFLKFSLFHKVLVPMLYKLTYVPDYQSLMRYVFVPNARDVFKNEHKHFENRIIEMASEISTFVPDSSFVYVTHHPHVRGLVESVVKGQIHQPIVSELISSLKEKCCVNVLDARKYVKKIHGEKLLDDTFEEGDPFSHLGANGAARYGEWIASQIDIK